MQTSISVLDLQAQLYTKNSRVKYVIMIKSTIVIYVTLDNLI